LDTETQVDGTYLIVEDTNMKTMTVDLPLNRWPYGLELQPSANGLLLRPRRKARAHWSKAFRRRSTNDDLSSVRRLTNDFDAGEWEW
jgi:hypothetical protein